MHSIKYNIKKIENGWIIFIEDRISTEEKYFKNKEELMNYLDNRLK